MIVLDSGLGMFDKLSFRATVGIYNVGADGCGFALDFGKFVTSCCTGDQCLATVAALRLTDA